MLKNNMNTYDYFTPLMSGVQKVTSWWPGVLTLGVVSWIIDMVDTVVPVGEGTMNRIIRYGVDGATQLFTFATYDAIKESYHK